MEETKRFLEIQNKRMDFEDRVGVTVEEFVERVVEKLDETTKEEVIGEL